MTSEDRLLLKQRKLFIITSKISNLPYVSAKGEVFTFSKEDMAMDFIENSSVDDLSCTSFGKMNGKKLLSLYNLGINTIFVGDPKKNLILPLTSEDIFANSFTNPTTGFNVIRFSETYAKKYLLDLLNSSSFIIMTELTKRPLKCFPNIKYTSFHTDDEKEIFCIFTDIEKYNAFFNATKDKYPALSSEGIKTTYAPLLVTFEKIRYLLKESVSFYINPTSEAILLTSDMIRRIYDEK